VEVGESVEVGENVEVRESVEGGGGKKGVEVEGGESVFQFPTLARDSFGHLSVPLCYVMSCYVTLRAPTPLILPYGMEECSGREDMGYRPLREPMTHHPIPEPRRWDIRVPIPKPLMWSIFHLV
jgi:hypothetical protein